MRLDYKILWIDDDKDDVETLAESLNDFLQSQGFVLKKIWAKDEKSLEDLLSTTIDFDFIFVDNSFDDEELGVEFIEQLRNKKVYADILFFSSVASKEKLKKEVIKKSIQSIYIYTKTEITRDPSLFENIIQYRINKEMDTASLRGIAMAEVAEFDSIIWDIIKSHSNCKDKLADVVKDCRQSKYQELRNKDAEYIWQKIDEKGTAIIDSCHMHKFLCEEILKDKKLRYVEEAHECSEAYHPKILKKRNLLAHKRDCMGIDEQIEFRKDLIKFREIFNKLKQELCA